MKTLQRFSIFSALGLAAVFCLIHFVIQDSTGYFHRKDTEHFKKILPGIFAECFGFALSDSAKALSVEQIPGGDILSGGVIKLGTADVPKVQKLLKETVRENAIATRVTGEKHYSWCSAKKDPSCLSFSFPRPGREEWSVVQCTLSYERSLATISLDYGYN